MSNTTTATMSNVTTTTSATLQYQRDASVGDLSSLMRLEEVHHSSGELFPNGDDDFAFRAASFNGHTHVVAHLLNTTLVDIHAKNDASFVGACQRGHVEVANMLLASAVFSDNTLIRATHTAIMHKRVLVLQLLFASKRKVFHDHSLYMCEEMALHGLVGSIDCFMQYRTTSKQRKITTHMIEFSIENKCSTALRYYLDVVADTKPKFTPFLPTEAVLDAIRIMDEDLVVELIQHCAFDANNRVLSEASLEGLNDVVELLLARDGVDIASDDYACIKCAAQGDSDAVMEMLLTFQPGQLPVEPRVEALTIAVRMGHSDTVDTLLHYDDGSMIRAIDGFALITCAIEQGDHQIAGFIARESKLQLEDLHVYQLVLSASSINDLDLLEHLLRRNQLDKNWVSIAALHALCANAMIEDPQSKPFNHVCDMLVRFPGVRELLSLDKDKCPSNEWKLILQQFHANPLNLQELHYSTMRIICSTAMDRLIIKKIVFDSERQTMEQEANLNLLLSSGVYFECTYDNDVDFARSQKWIRAGCQGIPVIDSKRKVPFDFERPNPKKSKIF